MKKIISLLVVFAMLMTLAPTAFAATGNNSVELLSNAYEGSGVITDPWIVEELPTTIEGTFDAAAEDYYQFTATQAGTIDLVYPWTGCMVIAYVNATVVTEVDEETGETFSYFDGDFAEFPLEVSAGDRVDINLWGGTADYSVELSFEAAEVQEEVIGSMSKGNWTMSLDSVVYLNYYPKFNGFSDGFDFGTRGGYVLWTGDEATLLTAPRDLLQAGKENCVVCEGMQQNEAGEWYVQSPEIFAKNLGDTVYIRPYVLDANGEYVYGGINYYSPAQYCYDILGNLNEREDTRAVCAALLTYGAAAQTQFGYKTDALVTEGVDLSAYDLSFKDEYISALPTTSEIDQYIKDLAADFAANNGTKAGITAGGQTLSLQGAIRMTATFTIDTSVINLDDVDTMQVLFWNESEMFDLVALTQRNAYATELVADGNVYKAVSDHILAKNLGETIYFVARVIMNDGTMYRTGLLYLSVENWLAQEVKNNTANAEISKVIAVYGEMARVRFAENEEPACEHENTYEDFDYCYEDGNYDLLVICEDCGEEVARYAPGTVEANPFFIYNFEYNEEGTVATFVKELPAGTTYFGSYGVGGLTLTVTDAEGNVVSTQTLPTSWGRMPVYFTVDCETAGTYTLTLTYPLGSMQNPDTLLEEGNTVEVPADSWDGYILSWTAPADGLLTVTVEGDNWTYVVNNMTTYRYGDNKYGFAGDSNVETVQVAAGDEIWVQVNTMDENYGNPGGTLTVSMSFVPTLADGQYVISFGDLTFQALQESYNYGYAPAGDKNALTDIDVFTVTNTENGKFTLTDSYGRLVYMKGTYNSFNVTSDPSSVTEGHEWVLELAEDGNFYIKNVLKEKYIAYSNNYGNFGAYASISDTSVLTVTPYGAEEEPEVEPNLFLGNNELAAGGNWEYAESNNVYVAEQTGTLYLTFRAFGMNGFNYGEDMLTGWLASYTWIKVNGEVITSLRMELEVTEGDVITVDLVSSDGDNYYTWLWLDYEGYYEEPQGSALNPVQLAPEDCPTETIVIPAGESVHYNLDSVFGEGYTLYVYGEDAYIITYVYDFEVYDIVPKYIYAVDGVVTFPVTYYEIQIGNNGDTAATFELKADQPAGTVYNPDTLVLGENVANLPAESDGYYYSWTAEEDGVLTLVFDYENWMCYVENPGDPDSYSDDIYVSEAVAYGATTNSFAVVVKAGDVVTVMAKFLEPETYVEHGGTTVVVADFLANPGTLSLGDNTLSVDAETPSVGYAYTAEEDGYLYLTVAALLEDGFEADISYLEEYCSLYINGAKITSADPTVLHIYAGDVVAVKFVCEDLDYAYELVLNLAYGEAPAVDALPLVLGHNTMTAGTLNVSRYEHVETAYTFAAEQTGTLYFTVRTWCLDQGWGAQDYGMDLSSYYMSFIYINGVAVEALKTAVEVTAGDEVEFVLTSEAEYLITCEVYLSYEGFYEEPLGSELNPVVIGKNDVPCDTLEIEAGASVWYQFADEFMGVTLRVCGENAQVIVGYNDWGMWVEETFDAVDGVVELQLEVTTLIKIVNVGDSAATFVLEADIPSGTYNNPADMVLGDNEVSLEENSDGYYIKWIATESGELTITVTGDDNWYFNVTNRTAGTYSNYLQDKNGDVNTCTMSVSAGDEIVVFVRTMGNKATGDKWSSPAGNYVVTAEFVAAP